MIIIEKTASLTPGELREKIFRICMFIAAERKDFWIHVEKEGREIAINTDDDPIRPGMLAYGEYQEGGVPRAEWREPETRAELWPSICQELGL